MTTTRIVRDSLPAVAVVAVLLAIAAPAQAGWDVRVGVSARIVVPPVVVSAGTPAPFAPYVAPDPARCYANGYYAPYYAPCPPTVGVVVAPAVSYVRVWVPGPHPHWLLRPVVTRHHHGWR